MELLYKINVLNLPSSNEAEQSIKNILSSLSTIDCSDITIE